MSLGVIFDWDGVIIDSSSLHQKSWELLAQSENLPFDEQKFIASFGCKNTHIIPNVFVWANDPAEIKRLSSRKEELYRDLVQKDGIEPLPGAAELLRSLKDAQIPTAIGSSTERKNIDAILQVIGFQGFFQSIVSADDVTEGKPHPQVFLLAAQAISCNPDHCVVFEDAPAGIEAGLAANMQVIGVATTHAPETLNKAHLVVNQLSQINLTHIQNLLNANIA